jgi:hypothetical protein
MRHQEVLLVMTVDQVVCIPRVLLSRSFPQCPSLCRRRSRAARLRLGAAEPHRHRDQPAEMPRGHPTTGSGPPEAGLRSRGQGAPELRIGPTRDLTSFISHLRVPARHRWAGDRTRSTHLATHQRCPCGRGDNHRYECHAVAGSEPAIPLQDNWPGHLAGAATSEKPATPREMRQ